MTCYENSKEEIYENGVKKTSKNQRILKMMKEKADPGTARKTEEPQRIPLTQSYISKVFMTGLMNEWVMSMIEDNLETLRVPSSVLAWIES